MKINELSGLYVVENEDNFKILVAAFDEVDAREVAAGYFIDSHMNYRNLLISDFNDINTNFDCDYVIRAGY